MQFSHTKGRFDMSLAREINDYLEGNDMLKGDLPKAYSLLSRASEQLAEGVQTQSSEVPKQAISLLRRWQLSGDCSGDDTLYNDTDVFLNEQRRERQRK